VAALRPLVANELASAEIEWWVLVGDNAEHPIGFLGMTSGTIESLFIDPGHHRRGAGRFLVDHAQRLHPGALAVDVNEQNEAALRFYEALGFSVVRRSAQDGDGRPFPILHMQRPAPALHDCDRHAGGAANCCGASSRRRHAAHSSRLI